MVRLGSNDLGKEVVSICLLDRDQESESDLGIGVVGRDQDASRVMVDPYPLRYHSEMEGTVEWHWIEWLERQRRLVESKLEVLVGAVRRW